MYHCICFCHRIVYSIVQHYFFFIFSTIVSKINEVMPYNIVT